VRALLRRRDFRLLAIGQTLSALGDFAMFIALAIWVKDVTGSNAAAGLTLLPMNAPIVLGPLFGVFVDRYPRRLALIAADLFGAAIMFAPLLVHDRGDVWILYVVAFAYGVVDAVHEAARSGLLVSMLPEDDLGDANGLLQSANQGVRLVAPLAGAGLYAAMGGHAVAMFDAATFVASALFLLAVHTTDIERRRDEVRFLEELRDGLRHLWSTLDLRRVVLAAAFVGLLVGITEITFFALIDEGLHQPPAFLGVLSTIQGVGSVAAGVLVGWALRRTGELRILAIASLAAAIGQALFGTAILSLVLVSALGFGVANTFFNVAVITLVQRSTPLELQGRVMSAAGSFFVAPYSISLVIGALLVSVLPFAVIYAAEAVALTGVALLFLAFARSSDTAAAAVPADA
jgi:MFS family permease